ncbi:MAG: hypothetical protein M3Y08_18265 [Fibrobacterota bacterium]|nr:hypothetical protein [Fibrobacterota bacterium]
MKRTVLIPLILGLAAGGGCGTGGAGKKQSDPLKAKEKVMTLEEIPYLPFGLDKDTPLDQVEVSLAFHGAKTGAGKQEITLRGDGLVRLFFSRSTQDKAPKTIEGQCNPESILRLLDFMEGNGLFGLPDVVASHGHQHARRLLQVKVPGRMKQIGVDEPGLQAVEQMIGAVMLVAGQCAPEALNNRFFPNL